MYIREQNKLIFEILISHLLVVVTLLLKMYSKFVCSTKLDLLSLLACEGLSFIALILVYIHLYVYTCVFLFSKYIDMYIYVRT